MQSIYERKTEVYGSCRENETYFMPSTFCPCLVFYKIIREKRWNAPIWFSVCVILELYNFTALSNHIWFHSVNFPIIFETIIFVFLFT